MPAQFTSARSAVASSDLPAVTLYNQPAYTRQVAAALGGFVTARASGATIASTSFTLNSGVPIPVTPSYPDGWVSANVTLAQGPNTIVLSATDSAGNVQTAAQMVVVDQQPPSVQITSPLAGQVLGSTQISVGVSVTDQTPTHLVLPQGAADFATGSGTFNSTVDSGSDGTTTISVTATDSAGNSSTASVQVLVDSRAPGLSTFLADGSRWGRMNGDLLAWNIFVDSDSSATVTVDGNGYEVGGGGGVVFAQVKLTEGVNTFTARATNVSGQTSSLTRTVIYDLTGPTGHITNPLDGVTYSGDISVTAQATDALTDIQDLWFNVDGSGTVAATRSGTTFSAPLNTRNLVDGAHVANMYMLDVLGNISSRSVNFNVDNAHPALTWQNCDFTISAQATPAGGSTVFITRQSSFGCPYPAATITFDATYTMSRVSIIKGPLGVAASYTSKFSPAGGNITELNILQIDPVSMSQLRGESLFSPFRTSVYSGDLSLDGNSLVVQGTKSGILSGEIGSGPNYRASYADFFTNQTPPSIVAY